MMNKIKELRTDIINSNNHVSQALRELEYQAKKEETSSKYDFDEVMRQINETQKALEDAKNELKNFETG